MTSETVETAAAARLLEAVTEAATTCDDLAGRRTTIFLTLSDLVGADAGHWAWGQGRPERGSISPVAIIDFGYNDEQRAALAKWGLDARAHDELHVPVLKRMGDKNISCDTRRDLISDEEWNSTKWFWQMLRALDKESFLHAVRYSSAENWSNMLLVRNFGRPEFGPTETAIVHLALSSISWLHASPHEAVPAEALAGLTPRQKAVMLLLLDGMSRKKMAADLQITEETVNDHIKAIYKHFEVQSATALAAIFLRNQ